MSVFQERVLLITGSTSNTWRALSGPRTRVPLCLLPSGRRSVVAEPSPRATDRTAAPPRLRPSPLPPTVAPPVLPSARRARCLAAPSRTALRTAAARVRHAAYLPRPATIPPASSSLNPPGVLSLCRPHISGSSSLSGATISTGACRAAPPCAVVGEFRHRLPLLSGRLLLSPRPLPFSLQRRRRPSLRSPPPLSEPHRQNGPAGLIPSAAPLPCGPTDRSTGRGPWWTTQPRPTPVRRVHRLMNRSHRTSPQPGLR
ncbi:vegetative cell wall protein gp1-like [Phragmites australis]|uniref:vegetative cell wall protein gp1-like n=1 Tax=Phragmites australis TaxID=29695 RepID=UPI002D795369|nr:vegetative cell wall protein gp1-like [Phragmites australis]